MAAGDGHPSAGAGGNLYPPSAVTWRGNNVNNIWDINTTADWVTNGVAAKYGDGAAVTFDATGSNTLPVNVSTTVRPGSVSVNASKNYTFDVLARDPGNANNRLCIDVVVNESVYNKIIERGNIGSDLVASRYLIASLMPFKTEELRLAELYRIRIIHSDTEDGLVSSLVKLVQR